MECLATSILYMHKYTEVIVTMMQCIIKNSNFLLTVFAMQETETAFNVSFFYVD